MALELAFGAATDATEEEWEVVVGRRCRAPKKYGPAAQAMEVMNREMIEKNQLLIWEEFSRERGRAGATAARRKKTKASRRRPRRSERPRPRRCPRRRSPRLRRRRRRRASGSSQRNG